MHHSSIDVDHLLDELQGLQSLDIDTLELFDRSTGELEMEVSWGQRIDQLLSRGRFRVQALVEARRYVLRHEKVELVLVECSKERCVVTVQTQYSESSAAQCSTRRAHARKHAKVHESVRVLVRRTYERECKRES